MSHSLSPNTQAILLLTAPLIAGRRDSSSDLLKPGEYRRLVRFLRDKQREPADLLVPDARGLLEECQHLVGSDRLKSLLARGFLLSQAVERWQARAIWVVSRADAEYSRRLKARLKEDAPPVLYGCGDAALLDTGGLAVVGSRDVDDKLVEYAEGIGRLVARERRTLVSGGARGIDQAAMRGALETGGRVREQCFPQAHAFHRCRSAGMSPPAEAPGGEVLVYEAPNGEVRVDVRLDHETVWLTQAQMVNLFGRDQSVVSRHLRNVFAEGDLLAEGNMQKMHIASADKSAGGGPAGARSSAPACW